MSFTVLPWANSKADQAEKAADARLEPPTASSEPTDPVAEISALQRDRLECAEQIERLRGHATAIQRKTGARAESIDAMLEQWTVLDLVLAQNLSTLHRQTVLRDETEVWRERLEQLRLRGLDLSPPFAFVELEKARDYLALHQQKFSSVDQEVRNERNQLESERRVFDSTESTRRRLAETIRGGEAADDQQRQREQLAVETLKSRVSKAKMQLCRDRIAQLEKSHEQLSMAVEYYELRVAKLREGVQFTEQELRDRLAVFDEGEQQLRQHLAQIHERLRSLSLNARARNDESSGAIRQIAAIDEASANLEPNEPLQVDQQFEATHEELELVQQILAEVVVARESWNRRFELANNKVAQTTLQNWLDDTNAAEDRLNHLGERIRIELAQLRDDVSALDENKPRRLSLIDDQSASPSERDRDDKTLRLIRVYNGALQLVDAGIRLHGRFREDLERTIAPNRRSELMQISMHTAGKLWTYELAVIDDRPITVGKIVTGMVLFGVAFILSRFLSRNVSRRVLPRFGIDAAGTATIQTVSFYAMLGCCFFVCMEVVNVPLTVFTFLGGAIAIGVGFGSQNLLNNFISGLILLVERPIRIGDLVNVDGIEATVEQIGARSTRVRTGSHLDILVPNSKFLENNVANWTLTSTRIRTSVAVGVAYGSPTERVKEILHQVVVENSKTLKSPAPIVLFRDFADSSLNFEAHFWVQMRTMMEGETIKSDIRFAIDRAFRDAGISIAFPQRDVHVDLSAPLQVQLTDERVRSRSAA